MQEHKLSFIAIKIRTVVIMLAEKAFVVGSKNRVVCGDVR